MAEKMGEKTPAGGSQKGFDERRRENRYDVTDACRKYIELRVKNGTEFIPAILSNFSRNGILFECPVSFSQGKRTECIISNTLLLTREISLGIEVKYCKPNHGSYIMGASIDTISDEPWIDFFVEVYNFVVLRQGSV